MHTKRLGLATAALIWCQAQQVTLGQGSAPPVFLPASGLGGRTPAPGFASAIRMDLQEDSQDAEQARSSYAQYGQQVQQYITDIQARITEAHTRRGEVLTRTQELERTLPSLKGAPKQEAESELSQLRAWLSQESNMSAQAAKNVEYCQKWLRAKRADYNQARYNADEDEQAARDANQQAQEQAAQQRWQQQLAQHSSYYQQMNGMAYGGYPYYGRGYYHRGYGGYNWGHYGGHSGNMHVSGGHGFGGGHASFGHR